MPARIRLTLMAVATMVLLGALAVVLLTDPKGRAEPTGGLQGALPPPDMKTTDFALRDQDGKVARLADYLGKPVILTFLYSTCEDTCPIVAQQIKAANQQLDEKVPTLALSVDPANDTPTSARRFIREQGLSGQLRFLLGSRSELAPIWKAYGILPQGEGFDHTARVVVFDGRGRMRVAWPADQLTPEGLAHDLRLLSAKS